MSQPGDRGQRIRAAIFLLVGIAVVVAAVLVLGRSARLFARHVTLHASFDNVGGLIVGAPVRLAGVDVGTVRRIHFDRDPAVRRVDVDLSVGARYLDRIRADSVAHVTSKGLLGDMIIDISVGSEDVPALENGGRLRSAEAAALPAVIEGVQHALTSIDRLASDVDERVREVLTPQVAEDVGRAVHDLRETASRIDAAATDVQRLAREARTGRGALHELVYGTRLSSELDATAANLADATRALREGPGALHGLLYGDDATHLLADLGATARILHRLAAEVDEGKGTVGGLLKDPTVYQDLVELLGNVQRNKLLKALIRYEISRDGLRRPEAPAAGGAPVP